MIISQTPFRISFFGGGTDFPEYYQEHGGAVLATTIDKFCYISIHTLGPYFKYRFKVSYARSEATLRPEEIQHPLFRECLLHLGVQESLEIGHIADLPGRTGLGTSSSFTVGLLHALHRLAGRTRTARELAEEAIHIERVRVGDAGGHQDQFAAAFGGFMRVDFGPERDIRVTPIELTSSRRTQFGDQLMLFYLGIEQSAEAILSEQRKRVSHNIPALREMRAMVDEAQRILTGPGDLNAFGDLLHESWQRKKTLSSGISTGPIDDAYAAARAAGARGGKILGAGGRGFLLLFAEPACHSRIRDALKGLEEVHFRPGTEGSRIIFQQE